jgi:Flp pilus assembly protein TadD/predicted aspartyl protease
LPKIFRAAVALAGICPWQASAQALIPPSYDSLQVHFVSKDERKPVPLDIVHSHLLFQARVNGHDVWGMLDNGAQGTLIDTGFANSIRLGPGQAAAGARTVTGMLKRQIFRDVSIDLPGQVSLRSPVSAVDLSAISRTLGRPISLIIGKDYFDVLFFQIIVANKTLEVGPSGTLNVPDGTPALILNNDTPQVEIQIEGSPVTVAVDLGDDGVIGLSDAAFSRLGLNGRAAVQGNTFDAEGVAASTKTVLVKNVKVGPITASGVSVTEQPILAPNGDGRIGLGFFSRFNFAIDVKARRIWFLSPADEISRLNQLRTATEAAIRLYKSGHTADAEAKLTELASQAKWPEELNTLCWVKATAGTMLPSALQECRDAVQLSNRSAESVDSLGMALLQSGKLDEALDAYTEAIEKAHNAGSYMGRAIVYDRMGDVARAESDLAEAKRREPGVEGEFARYGLKLRTPSH